VVVREGASLGAHVTVIAGVVIGRWALAAAGAVVTADVPDFGLVVAFRPGGSAGVGRAGVPLHGARGGGGARRPVSSTPRPTVSCGR
jgi:hypothetical protein